MKNLLLVAALLISAQAMLERDDFGNILSMERTDNMETTYIRGYNQSLPVAKIENASFSQIEAIFGNDFDAGADGLSSAEENSLRNYPSMVAALITTYTYDLGVGITSQTDPNGQTTSYEYDSIGRLKAIKDHDGHVLQQNEYNYGN